MMHTLHLLAKLWLSYCDVNASFFTGLCCTHLYVLFCVHLLFTLTVARD